MCILLATPPHPHPPVWPLWACLLCPQLTSALPWDGLTLPSGLSSRQSTGCSRDAVSANIPSLGPPLGQDPGVQGRRGWGCSVGDLLGPRNEGGGRGGNGLNRFRLIPAPPLTSWVPAGGGVGGRDEPQGL